MQISSQDVHNLLRVLQAEPGYSGQVVHREWLGPRAARYASVDPRLPAPLTAALAAQGISKLYTHQAAALQAARAGQHVGVITATASGKTLCYQLPLLEAALRDPRERALLLFPTKALAQDQLRSLRELTQAMPLIRSGIYDGDTPQAERATLRVSATLLLSNPDMLHLGILPNHQRWARFLGRLRYVVVDEAHTYRGVFGSNVALLLRRLRRLCAEYGGEPQFLLCSATIANPHEHLSALVGAPVAIVDDDGAPRGSREFVFWNPPLIETRQQGDRDIAKQDEAAWLSAEPDAPRLRASARAAHRLPVALSEQQAARQGQQLNQSPAAPKSAQSGARRSTNGETTAIFTTLVRHGVKSLAFTRARKVAELILRYAQEALRREAPELGGSIAAYRAGYLPEQRRRIEQALQRDELRGVISTNALELGVDIGGLDAVVLNGYPGTIASTWQQVGRAGRKQGHSLAVLVALEDPIDQFYMRHPQQFFGRTSEHARIALENPYILADHLRCAAYEKPLEADDARWFGALMQLLVAELVADGLLVARGSRAFALPQSYPAEDVSIRASSAQQVELRDADGGRLIERIDAARAPYEVHGGAVYLHQGEEFLVSELDLARRVALARPASISYYTQPRDVTDIQILEVLCEKEAGATTACFSEVDVTRTVVGFRRKAHYSEALLGEFELDMPPQSFMTQSIFFTVPSPICMQVAAACGDLPGALHALEHAMISLLPLFAMCDRWDIGGVSTAMHPDTGEATIFIYDGVPGGVGLSELGYERLIEWWQATLELLRECPCEAGCPSCVHSPKCGNGNAPLDKDGARLLVELLLAE